MNLEFVVFHRNFCDFRICGLCGVFALGVLRGASTTLAHHTSGFALEIRTVASLCPSLCGRHRWHLFGTLYVFSWTTYKCERFAIPFFSGALGFSLGLKDYCSPASLVLRLLWFSCFSPLPAPLLSVFFCSAFVLWPVPYKL